MDPYSQDIYKLALDLISLLGVAAVPFLLRLANRIVANHLTQQQQELTRTIAVTAVHAAEALGASRHISQNEKLAEAADRARDLASRHGINLSDEQWRTLLEAAVMQMKAANQELAVKEPASP